MTKEFIYEQAKSLAMENKKVEPGIQNVFWFPDSVEVRLIEIEDIVPPSCDGLVEPFYFSSTNKIKAPSAIAVIRSDEYKKLTLPQGWGGWNDAQEIEIS